MTSNAYILFTKLGGIIIYIITIWLVYLTNKRVNKLKILTIFKHA